MHDWATHTGHGTEEDDPNSFHAAVEKRCQYHYDLLDIVSDSASMQPWVSSDGITKSKATCTSPRGAGHRMNYIESGSSDKNKDNENNEHDQDMDNMVEALASTRFMIGARKEYINKGDKDDQDENIEEKHEDLSFIQTTIMTQGDFCNAHSISSRASSALPEVTAVSSEVVGTRTPQNMVDRTPVMSNKK